MLEVIDNSSDYKVFLSKNKKYLIISKRFSLEVNSYIRYIFDVNKGRFINITYDYLDLNSKFIHDSNSKNKIINYLVNNSNTNYLDYYNSHWARSVDNTTLFINNKTNRIDCLTQNIELEAIKYKDHKKHILNNDEKISNKTKISK